MSAKKRASSAGEANFGRVFDYEPPCSRLRTSVLYDNIIVDRDFRPFVINECSPYLFPRVAHAYGYCLAWFLTLVTSRSKLKLTSVRWSWSPAAINCIMLLFFRCAASLGFFVLVTHVAHRSNTRVFLFFTHMYFEFAIRFDIHRVPSFGGGASRKFETP